ncbi:MAG TPA: hypothetical protein DCZ03_03155 [Gammaproteobacteria bacterium]|nr:hypothetical protein [Gammaproteobacteria bacterium]
MTKERLIELDRLIKEALIESLLMENINDTAIAFWRGAEAVVEDLKLSSDFFCDEPIDNRLKGSVCQRTRDKKL